MGKKHVLTVPGLYDEIKTICRFVMQGAEAAGMDETALFHIELACDEACTNVIEHAYGGEGGGDVKVSWQVKGNVFIITVMDNGRRFEPDQIPAPPPADNVDKIKIGGLGIHFMRKLMDEVSFSFNPQTGNELIMKKKIKTEAS